MAGRRKKGRKKRKQPANTVFQRIVSVTNACFGRKKSNSGTSVAVNGCEEVIEESYGQDVDLVNRPEQNFLQMSKYRVKVSKKISIWDAVYSGPTEGGANNTAHVENIMKVVFAECNYMTWFIPYLAERDDGASKECVVNDQATEGKAEQIDKECVLFVQSIISMAIKEVGEEHLEDAMKRQTEIEIFEVCTDIVESLIDAAVTKSEEEQFNKECQIIVSSILDAVTNGIEQEEVERKTTSEEETFEICNRLVQSLIDNAAAKSREEQLNKECQIISQSILDSTINKIEQEEAANIREEDKKALEMCKNEEECFADATIMKCEEEKLTNECHIFINSIISAAIGEIEQEQLEAERKRKADKEAFEMCTNIVETLIDAAVSRSQEEQLFKECNVFVQFIINEAIHEIESQEIEKKRKADEESFDVCSRFVESLIDAAVTESHDEDLNKECFIFVQSVLDAAVYEIEQEEAEKNRKAKEKALETCPNQEILIQAAAAQNREQQHNREFQSFTESTIGVAINELEEEAAQKAKTDEVSEMCASIVDALINSAVTVAQEVELNLEVNRLVQSIIDSAIDQIGQKQLEANMKVKSESGRSIQPTSDIGVSKVSAIPIVEPERYVKDDKKKMNKEKQIFSSGTKKKTGVKMAKAKSKQTRKVITSKSMTKEERTPQNQNSRNGKNVCSKLRRSKYWKAMKDRNKQWGRLQQARNNKDNGAGDDNQHTNESRKSKDDMGKEDPLQNSTQNNAQDTSQQEFKADIEISECATGSTSTISIQNQGYKTTEESPFHSSLSLNTKLPAKGGTTVQEMDTNEENVANKTKKKRIRKHKQHQRSRYIKSQKDTEQHCNLQGIQKDEMTVKPAMDGFEVHYSCLMDDFCFDLLEVKTIALSGKFGKTFQAKYDEHPVEVTFYRENFPAVDPGRLLILRSNFVSRALVYLQDDNEFDCIIYPDNYIGTIWDLMEADPNRRHLGEDHAMSILSGMMEGIKHISSKRIVHGHLTPDLVRLNRKGYPVICDFNFAYTYKPGKLVQSRSEEFNADYLAPELSSGANIVPETDIFAVGCIAYEIIVGLPPFTGDCEAQTVKNVLDNNYRIEFDTRLFSERTAAVVGACLRRNVDERREWEEMYAFLLEPELDIDQEKESFLLPLIKQLLKI